MISCNQYINLRTIYDTEGHTVDKRRWVGGSKSIRPKAIPPFCEVVTRQVMKWYPMRIQDAFKNPSVNEVVTVTALVKARHELGETKKEPCHKKTQQYL